MLSKNKIKQLRSLSMKKYRTKEQLFIAEGKKSVFDLIDEKFDIAEILCVNSVLADLEKRGVSMQLVQSCGTDCMGKVSQLKSAPEIIAVVRIPSHKVDMNEIRHDLSIALDGVQDPGNLGSIVRSADWFGIKNIVCSCDTVDIYNPKSVQATMGAISRVKVHYISLPYFLKQTQKQDIVVYGTSVRGESIYKESLSSNGVIVFGNEGRGVTDDVNNLVTKQIHIPSYPPGNCSSESLNVAMSASIVCAEFRRRAILYS